MSTENAGWYYQKGYYRKLVEDGLLNSTLLKNNDDDTDKKNPNPHKFPNGKILGLRLPELTESFDSQRADFISFPLQTTDPGFLIGLGAPHELKLRGEYKLGLHFDHALGVPVIPGSSVKGVIRSAFEKPAYLISILEEINPELTGKLDPLEIQRLEHRLFDGVKKEGQGPKKELSVYERFIFHDALPIQGENADRSPYLIEDFITYHYSDEADGMLKEPNPVNFLMLRKDITFHFRFEFPLLKEAGDPTCYFLNEAEDDIWELSYEQLQALFQQIILDLGIGAKTRHGYGRFSPLQQSNNS